MFSEYASKFLTQSHSRLSSIHGPLNQPSSAPLFYSTADYNPTEESSGAGFGGVYSRYANYIQESESEDDEDDNRHNPAIGSSWRYDKQGDDSNGNFSTRLNNLESVELDRDEGKAESEDESEDEDDLNPGAAFIEHVLPSSSTQYKETEPDSPPTDITFESKGKSSPKRKKNITDGFHSYLNPNQPVYNEIKEISIIPHLSHPQMNPVWYDAIWSMLFFFLMAAMFSTSIIVWLSTTKPTNVPDTVYFSIISNTGMLIKYTIWASLLSIAWFVVLVKQSRGLFYLSVISVPIALVYITFHTYSRSFYSSHGGFTLQDKLMRLAAVVPLVLASLWCLFIYRYRSRMQSTLNLISRTIVILNEFQMPLIYLSIGSVLSYALFSLVWLSMFCHLFLQGHHLISSGGGGGGRLAWSLSIKAWSLAIFYVLMYVWTYFIIAGLGRAATAATVGQYWFHKNTFPAVSPDRVMLAAVRYASSTQFGSICLSSLITLLLRLPILLTTPTRLFPLLRLLNIPIYLTLNMAVTTTPFARARHRLRTLSDPLSLTRSVITGSSLLNSFPGVQTNEYWMAKLFIVSTRIVVCLLFGFSAWVHATTTNDDNSSSSNTTTGSLYGYAVGLLVGWWTWVVMGGSGAVVNGVLDGMVVCQGIRADGQDRESEAQEDPL